VERARTEADARARDRSFALQSIDQTQTWMTKALSFAVAIGAGHPEVALKWAVDAEDLPLTSLAWLGDPAPVRAYLEMIAMVSKRAADGQPWTHDDQKAYVETRGLVVTALTDQRQRVINGEPVELIPSEVLEELVSTDAMIGVMWPPSAVSQDAVDGQTDVDSEPLDATPTPRAAKAAPAAGASARDVAPAVLPGRADIHAALVRAAVVPSDDGEEAQLNDAGKASRKALARAGRL
jgi:hypothetical protein